MRSLRVYQFDLEDTIESGQTFNWVKEGDGYVSTDVGQAVYVEQRDDKLFYESSKRSVELSSFFRLDDPLPLIHAEIGRDEFMRESIEFAPGLRIVTNPFFPCLISFICSIRKNIPTIKNLMQSFRKQFGPTFEFRGKKYSGFPSPEVIARASLKELRNMGLGWRAEFVKESSRAIIDEEISRDGLVELEYEVAHKKLKTLHGVGDKVADCVCLFSLGFLEAFPIDIWMERIIQGKYGIFTETGKSYSKKSCAAREYFGRYAGYAQEYLFYYTRSRKQAALE
ncbi:MAG: DNA-3-methyladenine glycosylase family protein [Promethearchaeota archaeon]